MKRPFWVTGCLVLILFVGSCGKSTCLNPGINVTFSGFNQVELYRVLIQQYASNSNFSTLISVSVYDTAYTQVQQSNDTIYMPVIDTGGTYIAPGYDYIVAVPAVTQSFFADSVFKISKISYTPVKLKVSGSNGVCTNDVSYYLDSIPHKISGTSLSGPPLPLVKIVLNK